MTPTQASLNTNTCFTYVTTHGVQGIEKLRVKTNLNFKELGRD